MIVADVTNRRHQPFASGGRTAGKSAKLLFDVPKETQSLTILADDRFEPRADTIGPHSEVLTVFVR